ncbi:ABC transporter substrate-binding protein [Amycolatopsis sp. GM8]|uniref:ABC transporter substrate-binding protein n=1 Tax=Amycolatopsis sp. GM8 TaxID=2896530 RepID=UPI001F414400|nr:sugar ABC transporter substrate-binding protein [Amycolatopsis sp. GM8]
MKRVVGAAAVALSFAVAIAGCSSTTSSGGGDATKLSLMIWDPAQKAGVQKAVDGFEAKFPKIQVDVQQVPQDQYYTKLDASLSAGEGPDVMWQSSAVSQYINGGALEPLDGYIKQDSVNLSDYASSITSLYNVNGKQYGIPKDEDTWTFVYNTAVFAKLGVTDVPTNDWTWDDMVRIAKEIKAKQTSPTDVPMSCDRTFNNGVASLIHQLGGKIVNQNKGVVSSPEGIQALTMMKGLQDQGLIPVVANSADFNPASSLISGTVAMAEIPSWNLSLLSQANVPADTFHLVRAPSVNGKWLTDTNGLAYVMNANSRHKDEAWKLIEYLTSTQGAEQHAAGGAAIPANTDKAAFDAYVSANSKLAGLSDAVAAARQQNYLRTSTQYPATRAPLPQIESTQMGPFYAGSITASDAAKGIDQILDKALG